MRLVRQAPTVPTRPQIIHMYMYSYKQIPKWMHVQFETTMCVLRHSCLSSSVFEQGVAPASAVPSVCPMIVNLLDEIIIGLALFCVDGVRGKLREIDRVPCPHAPCIHDHVCVCDTATCDGGMLCDTCRSSDVRASCWQSRSSRLVALASIGRVAILVPKWASPPTSCGFRRTATCSGRCSQV